MSSPAPLLVSVVAVAEFAFIFIWLVYTVSNPVAPDRSPGGELDGE